MDSFLTPTPYEVHLPVFEGPLDLLLQLIEREKLDISTVSLAQVADQFLEHVQTLERVQAGTLADFLVMAARLVWIKSRLLLPQPEQPAEEEEEDPAEALARQLREYKRFKEAATMLRAIEECGQHAYVRIAPITPPAELERRLGEGELTVADLFAAALAAFTAAPPPPIPAGVVAPFTLTIGDQVRLIQRATASGRSVTFRSLLQHAHHRLEIIVTLLAVLELIKRQQLKVAQAAMFGEISIVPIDGVEITVNGAADGGQSGNGGVVT